MKSSKQKLNTTSSTKYEVIGTSEYLPHNVWTELNMAVIEHFFQDNMSSMKSEKNGRGSCGQKSRHIDVRFFWIKDPIQSGNIDLRYCPTEDMVADYFTKPLQCAAFQKFRSC